MIFDAAPPPSLIIPDRGLISRPAIIRPVEDRLLSPGYLPATRSERRAAVAELIRSGVLSERDAKNALVVKLSPYAAMLSVTNLSGFGSAAAVADITLIDDGDDSSADSNSGGVATFNSKTSTGPHTFVLIGADHDAAPTLSSATFDGSAMSILVQKTYSSGSPVVAICYIAGAQSGNVVLTFSGSISGPGITIVSLDNMVSATPVDTDNASGGSGAAALSALASPGVGGARLIVCAFKDASGVSWAGATEIADYTSVYRVSAAYSLGDDGGTVTATDTGGSRWAICGVSMR